MDHINDTIIRYEELRKLVNEGTVNLIDVRSHDEVKSTGKIGKAVIIPVATVKEALLLPDNEFSCKYGFTKPRTDDDKLVFMCMAGVRCKNACAIARNLGFVKARYYEGSWREWAAKEKV